MPLELLVNGPQSARTSFVLAHGAGAPMDSGFMNEIAGGLVGEGYRVVRFEFPYMARRREQGSKRPPDREPVLRSSWLEVIGELGAARLIIGGKSLGGRMASLIADEAGVAGLVCLGYPFHPIGKPDKLRVDHLQSIRTRSLIVQGTRDPFGTQSDVETYSLAPSIQLHWLTDGDHSFKPRKSSGVTLQQNIDEAVAAMARFERSLPAK